ncbi:MAG: tRNA (guanosine(46)-N7)-methyltransferase TrmB [Clostridiales bacterium]|uniref:tRNA (guanosine(46)-N7)-methyltransferase TrmB n=1 Tax=Clostridium sp. N3C TaxID=1776758 RepID=UPI00092E1B78|nr:tRNA (guanosine(46)-N7)-methyltransferase TrmB [Clostridium sp. N3C]NLZ49243.1 tRNA (guanosine(46)-N7)-methyltransferase TrmB [Clostridiales bacterium]SCN24786.1 tRNA (guanine-N(7)-)-methyltransferase [Clostridium sp. N3C]
MRLRKKWWARPEMEQSPCVIIEPKQFKGKWQEVFNNSNPIHLELGCGRGRFISTKADENRDINYIGIDLKDEVLVYAVRKVVEKELDNVKIIPMNINWIGDVFDKDEISKIYINFCNPWPKLRHNKRRLTHSNFLRIYKSFLKPSSEIWFKTDDQGLFSDSIVYFEESGFEIKYITYDLHNSGFEQNIVTEYEEKFTSLGMKTMFLIAKLK